MSRKIAHIGIAVENLDDAVKTFTTLLGYDPESFDEIPERDVRFAFFRTGESQLELLEGTSPESSISKYVRKNGSGIHHICLKVDDLQAELDRLKQEGVRLIDDTPRPGAEGTIIAFIHPKSCNGILIELQQG